MAPTTSLPSPALSPIITIPSSAGGISATLAANEAMDARRRRGERVLPMAFGEAGLPVLPELCDALAAASALNSYGPVAGRAALREAAAGYWSRRGLPTDSGDVVCGPGSKALLFALLLTLGSDVEVAIPRPSWVSYAAQTRMLGLRPCLVDIVPGQGGVPDPEALARAVVSARAGGRRIGAVIVTLPDNPTGTLASAGCVRALCDVAARHGLLIVSDEIYRDLVHAPDAPFPSPAAFAPDRTVISTGLSKNLALGGWRLGVARLPTAAHRDRLLAVASEIWSAPAGPVQHAAALAFGEGPDVSERISRSRVLHGAVARAVASRFAAIGADVPPPAGGFYVYPDLTPHRALLRARYGVSTSADLAALLLCEHGIAVLPGSAFGEPASSLRLRVAVSRLYGEAQWQQEAALASADPARLPWITSSLTWLSDALTDLVALGHPRPARTPRAPRPPLRPHAPPPVLRSAPHLLAPYARVRPSVPPGMSRFFTTRDPGGVAKE
jgi:aspartate aminotransferase